jgi:hypothetical protein
MRAWQRLFKRHALKFKHAGTVNVLTCCEGMLARVLAVVHIQLRSLATRGIIASVQDSLTLRHDVLAVYITAQKYAAGPGGP